MPQELHVVRCYNCEAFQVDIVKKVPKWICKMCGEKQSLKKVYAKGTGKECRQFVQDLNQQRLVKQNSSHEVGIGDVAGDTCGADFDERISKKPKLNDDYLCKNTSKWDEFLRNRDSDLSTTDCSKDELEYNGLKSKEISQNSNEKSCDRIEEHVKSRFETVTKQNNSVYKNRFESDGDFDFDLEF